MVLSTETPHHLYFLRELRNRCRGVISLDLVIMEHREFPYRELGLRHLKKHWYNPVQSFLLNPYIQFPYRQKEQAAYELEHFFPNGNYDYDPDLRVEHVGSVNNDTAIASIKEISPDLILVYGTALVRSSVFELPTIATINAHGGILPNYRGLDSNIWALWRGDYQNMGVSLHHMDKHFDTGPIYSMRKLSLASDISLVSLRYHTTLLATDMYVDLINAIAKERLKPQVQLANSGRYYSYFPRLLKPLLERKLARYLKNMRAN